MEKFPKVHEDIGYFSGKKKQKFCYSQHKSCEPGGPGANEKEEKRKETKLMGSKRERERERERERVFSGPFRVELTRFTL